MSRSAALRSKTISLGLGTAAGIAIGVGALAYVGAGSTPKFSDAGACAGLRRMESFGPSAGIWELQDAEAKRDVRFQDDPSRPGELLTTQEDKPGKPVKSLSREAVGYSIAGDVGLFTENYAPAGPAVTVDLDGKSLTLQRFARRGGETCAMRWVWFDPASRDVFKLEDHTFDGTIVHSARLKVAPASREPMPPLPAAQKRERGSFAELVAKSPMPLYEPARLPAGFRRVDHLGLTYRSTLVPPKPSIEVAMIWYSDGIARFALMMARPDDMKELDDVARSTSRSGSSETCATTDSPLVEIPGDGSIVIQRRADRCRTVLRRTDLPSVTVVLIGFNEIPGRLYEETMQSLVHVPGSK